MASFSNRDDATNRLSMSNDSSYKFYFFINNSRHFHLAISTARVKDRNRFVGLEGIYVIIEGMGCAFEVVARAIKSP